MNFSNSFHFSILLQFFNKRHQDKENSQKILELKYYNMHIFFYIKNINYKKTLKIILYFVNKDFFSLLSN